MLKWELLEGDFLAHLESAHAPDLIFYDPFSTKTDSPLWTVETFARLRERCETAELATYSSSTAVRAALLATGFFVARGVPTGDRAETTRAFTRRPDAPLLGKEWLERWGRSQAQFPAGIDERGRTEFERRIRGHAQFVGAEK